MFNSFLTFINQSGWDLEHAHSLLTVSGGIDSVVMLDLFYRAGFPFSIAHCNFGLRGEESQADEEFVRQLAKKYGCALHVQHFDTKAFAKSTGTSTQMAARTLRYAWFEEIRAQHGYHWVATAHHVNDSIETTILNLVRGTGIAGLAGVPMQTGSVIRPLLFTSRSAIVDYIETHQLYWREDSSNRSIDYKRNKVRHLVIPVLKELNPSLEHSFIQSAARVRAAGNLLESFLEILEKQVVTEQQGQIVIDSAQVLQMPESVYVLAHVLKKYGFGYVQAEQIIGTLSGGLSGKAFYSATHTVLKDRDRLVVKVREKNEQVRVHLKEGEEEVSIINGHLLLKWLKKDESFELIKDINVGYFDCSTLEFPLMVRNWEFGDIFCPFGMKGRKKKVSDLLIDSKFSAFQKENVQVLVDKSGQIVWVIGLRTDERYAVKEKTKNILKIFLKVTG
jgi:tRNA(Ile)-lysidine synthase